MKSLNPERVCDSCKGTGIFGGATCDDVWEPCADPDHDAETEMEDE